MLEFEDIIQPQHAHTPTLQYVSLMSNIKLACETYTWQMPGEQYKGKLEHIMDVVSQAGFAGIEPETSFMQHLEDPILMKEALDKYSLDLAVLCVVEDWLGPK